MAAAAVAAAAAEAVHDSAEAFVSLVVVMVLWYAKVDLVCTKMNMSIVVVNSAAVAVAVAARWVCLVD